MTATVIIPFRPDSLERADALTYVSRRWADSPIPVVVALDAVESPWCKAKTIAKAIKGIDSDLVIIADADCWVSQERIQSTVLGLNQWHDWGMPHRRVVRLDANYTRRLIDSDELPELDRANVEEWPYTALRAAGGIVVLKREAWDRVPMDPRFLGWGFEDIAWWYALKTLVGVPWRGKADLFHLWHPRDVPMDRNERAEQADPAALALLNRYKAALHRPVQMQEIVNEAKLALSSAGRSG